MSGKFYIVATPIGNLADLSNRAVEILKAVDFIAAEDTRHAKVLLQHYGINTPCISLHQHNEKQRSTTIIERLQAGQQGALVSDAGTPLISDPGSCLLQALRAADMTVIPIPGACALTTALSGSGLSAERFLFLGFLPAKSGQRCQTLKPWLRFPHTIAFYEAPHRIIACLQDLQTVFGATREIVIARELTKHFERFYSGTVADILQHFIEHNDECRGEIVVLIKGDDSEQEIDDTIIKMLEVLRAELPASQAVALVAKMTGVSKNVLYRWVQHH